MKYGDRVRRIEYRMGGREVIGLKEDDGPIICEGVEYTDEDFEQTFGKNGLVIHLIDDFESNRGNEATTPITDTKE